VPVLALSSKNGRYYVRVRVINALINFLGGFGITLLGIGIGAVTLDSVINDSALLLSRGLWLSATGIVMSALYVILFSIVGD
jgi:hypothetical protein